MSDAHETTNAPSFPVGNRWRLLVFIGFGLVSILTGFVLTPSVSGILAGLRMQQMSAGLLDTNILALVGANIGAPFVNAGLLIIFVMISYMVTGTTVDYVQILAAYMVYGFGFCGKTLWNIWPLFVGALLYAVIHKKPLRTVTATGWFASALSPMVTLVAFYVRGNGSANEVIGEELLFGGGALVLAVGIGLVAGYLVAVFGTILPEKHGGLTMYNVGLAAGLTGFLIFSFMKAIGLGHTTAGPFHEYPDIGNQTIMSAVVALLAYLLVCGVLISSKEKVQPYQLTSAKYEGSAITQFGFGPTLVNMSICGLVGVVYWILTITGNAHSPLLACIFTVVGLASGGASIRTMVPIMAGVYLTSVATGSIRAALSGLPVAQTAWDYVGSKNMIIAALFACGMSPVVYRYGVLIGLLAGAIHSILVPTTGALSGWMNLYNNGFCVGLVVTFFVPLLATLFRKKEI